MKKFFSLFAVVLCISFATAQINQYFWLNGKLMFGTPIAQTDSLTYSPQTTEDTLHLPLRTVIVERVIDTLYVPLEEELPSPIYTPEPELLHDSLHLLVPMAQSVIVHDTVYVHRTYRIPEGALSGLFSVSADKQVRFSKGNLQYRASTGTWRFAENQWSYVGDATYGNVYENGRKCNNSLISSTYSGWIDLFGFSTPANYYGVTSSTNYSDYAGENVDWGNVIGNEWRTPTVSEWRYLLKERNGARDKCSKATVNGIRGVIVFPDNWIQSENIDYNATAASFSTNVYSLSEWQTLEDLGAVFFPAGNTRNGTYLYSNSGGFGNYWSVSIIDSQHAYDFSFSSPAQELNPNNNVPRYYGRSVRLVHDATNDIIIPCDSVIRTTIEETIAEGDTYSFAGEALSETGIYVDTLVSAGGCDSIVSLYLIVDHTSGLPEGTLPGLFSVAANKQVRFSKGNLQYNAVQGTHLCADGSTKQGTWRFAERQYDYIGDANSNIGANYDGWIDLFGWGTSGYNDRMPYMTSRSYGDYVHNYEKIAGTNYDWGVYNSISNGGDAINKWRTMTHSDFGYITDYRSNSIHFNFETYVDGIFGYVLLPDDWIAPNNLGRKSEYTAVEWALMEAQGAVFLVAAGMRNGVAVWSDGKFGRYWDSTNQIYGISDLVSIFEFSIIHHFFEFCRPNYGLSVRLVQDVE